MAEIRGCDLVVEYLLKEKIPYLLAMPGTARSGCSTASTTIRTS